MLTKCIECAVEKGADHFYAHSRMASGHVNVCKDCHKLRMKNRRRLNPCVQEYDRQRSKTPDRTAQRSACNRAWRAANPLAYKAHSTVSNAIRSGRLIKQPCEFCGDKNVHAHHKDYSRPLDVIWLCPKCHHRLHAAFPELEGKRKTG